MPKGISKSDPQLSLKSAMIASCLPSTIMVDNVEDNSCCSVVVEVRLETNIPPQKCPFSVPQSIFSKPTTAGARLVTIYAWNSIKYPLSGRAEATNGRITHNYVW
jgi:hypothetical protein